MDVILVDMPQEMLNDAKWHLQQAERYAATGGAIFDLWHEVRAAAVFAIAAVESLLNKVAYEYVQRNPNLDQITKDYLTEQQSWLNNGKLKSRKIRLSLDEKLGGWTKVITGNAFNKSDKVWQDFKKVKDFRDSLIHYKPPMGQNVYGKGDIKMARLAIASAQAIIQRFYDAWGQTTPSWVTAPYR